MRREAVHGTHRSGTTAFARSSEISGLTVCRCRCGGTWRCCSASTTLISPATPAADSAWPMFVLTEPSRNLSWSPRPSDSTAPRARTSIGSPIGVPVPCASTYETSRGCSPASRRASLIKASWARPFGTVMPLLCPSWFIADPRMTARIGSPAATAASKGLEHHHAAALGADDAVGRRVERPALALGREHPRLGRDDHAVGAQHQVDAAGQRDLALAGAQAAAREVDGRERRGARGVDRNAWTLQPEHVGEPAGREVQRVAGHQVGVERTPSPRRRPPACSRCW